MTDPLPIIPFTQPLNHTLKLPGSKSITNRALILAALAKGTTRLEGALFSRDTEIMLSALKTLGIDCDIERSTETITVHGEGGTLRSASAKLHVGNAGTAARFLTAFLALHKGGTYHLDGDPAMRERPMAGLVDALRELNAADFQFHGKPGHFPFTLNANGYNGGTVAVDANASSQILSALLLAAPAGTGNIQLKCPNVRPAYVSITLKMREAFGAAPVAKDIQGIYSLDSLQYRPPSGGVYSIEPDLSAASYFTALTLIQGGQLSLSNLGPNPLQGDARFIDVLAHHGLKVTAESNKWKIERTADFKKGQAHREIDFTTFSDTFLTYAAITPLLDGPMRICGIGHTRHQETDRIQGMANELSGLGQFVNEEADALTIHPQLNELYARASKARKNNQILEIETYEDHRFAMSFGILGCFDLLGDGKPWLAIKNPQCCGKTFPDFFQVLDKLRDHSCG